MTNKMSWIQVLFSRYKSRIKHWRFIRATIFIQLSRQKSNHIYFTGTLNAAKWGAELARSSAKERIYIVEPLGDFENDPNVTDKGSLETRLAPTDPNHR